MKPYQVPHVECPQHEPLLLRVPLEGAGHDHADFFFVFTRGKGAGVSPCCTFGRKLGEIN